MQFWNYDNEYHQSFKLFVSSLWLFFWFRVFLKIIKEWQGFEEVNMKLRSQNKDTAFLISYTYNGMFGYVCD